MSRGGDEHRLTHADYVAVVTEVGGGLRLLTHEGRDLVRPYAADEVRPLYRGALLAPWPNRVVDARYRFDGQQLQLDVNEPERGHALHGLVTWSRFDTVERDSSSVTVSHRIVPQPGYPFEVEITARYSLDALGLTCTVEAHNHDASRAPYGVASHPYLMAGDGPVDRWSLELPADRVLDVTEDRLIPRDVIGVEAAGLDFRGGRLLDGLEVDHAFTGLAADPDGLVRARVRSDDGAGVECTWDPVALPWVQVHTADRPAPEPSRMALAVEPMSCPPDAFNSGVDLRVLPPGATARDEWRISAL